MKPLIIFLATLCCLAFGHAEVVCDLGNARTAIILHKPEQNLQYGSLEPMPDGKPALRFNWDSSRAHYFEFALREAIQLPVFERGVLRAKIYIPEDCQARNLSIRLRDSQGEHLQYRIPLSGEGTGWQEIAFPLDPEDSPNGGAWGGGEKANRKIDFPVSLVGFASEFPADTGPGWLGFGSITFAITSAPPELTLETGKGSAIHVLLPGEETTAGLRVVNRRPKSRELLLEYKLSDVFGQILDESASRFKLAPGETKFLALPPPKTFGVYTIDAKLFETRTTNETGADGAPLLFPQRLSYAYMQPAGPTPGRAEGFLFGLSVHTQRFSPAEQEREALAAGWCGAKVYREDIYWSRVNPEPGVWEWARYDSLLDLYDRYNMELQGIYVYQPRWIDQKFQENGSPEEWGEFVRRVTERYRDRIHYMEVWNEPDILTFRDKPALYIDILKNAYAEAKKVAPEMTILTGGFSGTVSTEHQARFVRRVLADAKGSYDVIAFHGHGSIDAYMPHMNALLAARTEFDISAPWYANETAIPSNWAGELGQGHTLFKKLLVSWANGAIGYTWYDLRNDGFDPKNAEHNYGLLTHDFYPKPAYGVYNMLAGYYREAKFLQPVNLGDGLRGYLFRARDGGFLLPVWSNDSSDQLLHLAGVKGKAALVDLFGNETPLPVINESVALAVGSMPATLRITQQEEAPILAGEFVICDDSFNISSGGEQPFRVRLHNPSDHPLLFSLGCTPPDGISGKGLGKKLQIEPGQSDEFSTVLHAGDGFYSLPERPKTIKLKTEIRSPHGDLLWEGIINREIHTVTTISDQGEGFNRPSDFDLHDASQITRLVPSAPSNEPYYWKGPEDLSARIWLGREGQALLVKAVVTDDVHAQPYRGTEVWKGDNVQMALQLPGQSGLWEVGLTRRNNGESEVFVWLAPTGFNTTEVAASIKLATKRDESAKTTTYEATIPFSTIGLSEEIGRRGFRFNLLVNDNDGHVRESYICIAPGIADDKNPKRYPTVSFR